MATASAPRTTAVIACPVAAAALRVGATRAAATRKPSATTSAAVSALTAAPLVNFNALKKTVAIFFHAVHVKKTVASESGVVARKVALI